MAQINGEKGAPGAAAQPNYGTLLSGAKAEHTRISSQLTELIKTPVTSENARDEVPKYTGLLRASLLLSKKNFKLFSDQIKSFSAQVKSLLDREEYLKVSGASTTNELLEAGQKIEQLTNEKEVMIAESAKLQSALSTLRDRFAALEATNRASESKVDRLTQENQHYVTQNVALNNVNANLAAKNGELTASASEATVKIARLTKDLAAANTAAKRVIDIGNFEGLDLSQSPDAQGNAGQGSPARPGGGKLRKTRGKRRRKYTRK